MQSPRESDTRPYRFNAVADILIFQKPRRQVTRTGPNSNKNQAQHATPLYDCMFQSSKRGLQGQKDPGSTSNLEDYSQDDIQFGRGVVVVPLNGPDANYFLTFSPEKNQNDHAPMRLHLESGQTAL